MEELEAKIKELEAALMKSNSAGIAIRKENLTLREQLAAQKAVVIAGEALPVEYRQQAAIMDLRMKQAGQFVKGGAFPDITPEQAYVIIEAGAEMGLQAIQALNDLYIYRGKVQFYGTGLINRVLSAGYRITYTNETPEGVTVTIIPNEGARGEEHSFIVNSSMKVFKSSKPNEEFTAAFRSAPMEKMRYHGVRVLVKFYFTWIISAAGAGDVYDIEFQSYEEVKEEPPQTISLPKGKASPKATPKTETKTETKKRPF